MKGLFKVMPQHLNRIGLATPNLNLVFLEPFKRGLAGVFGIIVLLYNPSALELEVTKLTAGHSGFSDRVQNSCFHQLWQVIQVLKLTITRPPPCLTAGMMFFSLNAVLVLCQM